MFYPKDVLPMSHRILSSVGKPSAAETLAFSEELAQPRIGAEF
jgi:hypothetical protein